MRDTIYQYEAYSIKYDENYIINSDTPMRIGLWFADNGDMVQVKSLYKVKLTKPAYQPTNTIEYTLYPELSLLILVLLALFMLVIWLFRKWVKAGK